MNGIVQAKLIGGFGNQLHQYVAARKYAELVGAVFETPEWVGRDVFGLREPLWSKDLPEVNDGGCGCPPEVEWGQTNVRLGGYFQWQRWIGLLKRSELRTWLRVDEQLVSRCDGVLPKGRYTAAHVRQGDYLGHPLYANVPERAYVQACAQYGMNIDAWVRQDAPRQVRGLGGRLDFLPDFLVLMRSSVLLRANSTFSWWAATLSHADVYAPVVTDHVGEYDAVFARGNWPRCADTSRTGPRVEDLHLPD